MVHAKNYETMAIFIKVMQKKLWPLFFPDTVYKQPSCIPSQLLNQQNVST